MSTSVYNAWIFDVDGVITDPVTKKVNPPTLTGKITQLLQDGNIVAFNTGRSISWLIDKDVIKKIENKLKDKTMMENFIAVGEKGGTWAWVENGKWQKKKDKTINIPNGLIEKVKILTKEYSDVMFFDKSKETMISVEMNDGVDLEKYEKEQKKFIMQIKKLIYKYDSFHLGIAPNPIAVDVQVKKEGKNRGAKRILKWLESKGIAPEHFITVGDSKSDLKMADELHEQGKSVEFVFVNENDKIKRENLPYPITFTEKKFGEGTLEFINSVHQ